MLEVMSDNRSHAGTLSGRVSSHHGITNFSVDEILRPDFGRKNITHSIEFLTSGLRVFSPLVVDSRTEPSRHLRIPTLEKKEDGPHVSTFCRLKLSGSVSKSSSRDHVYKSSHQQVPGTKFRSHFRNTNHSTQHSAREISSPLLNIASASPGCHSLPAGQAASSSKEQVKTEGGEQDDRMSWPAWVYCTRYSDRPSSGPRSRKLRRKEKPVDEKRPRTAFSSDQLQRLKREFEQNRYLNEQRRHELANELHLNESQIKIWFQNKRAKIKKGSNDKGGLALHLMAQGLYNHSTVVRSDDESDAKMDISGEGDS